MDFNIPRQRPRVEKVKHPKRILMTKKKHEINTLKRVGVPLQPEEVTFNRKQRW